MEQAMKKKTEIIVIAGATGYLGRYLIQVAKARGYWVRALVRRPVTETKADFRADEYFMAQATQAETLQGLCEGAVGVISALGITRQKDGFHYMDVDYQANLNLLNEALTAGVPRFAYVSVFKGAKLREASELVKAKERFVDALKAAPLAELIVRPTGFFSDMQDFLKMAAQGRVYLFGKGQKRLNPIHGLDLAEVILDAFDGNQSEINVGGPVTYTHRSLAELALKCQANNSTRSGRVICLPDVLRRLTLAVMPYIGRQGDYGPIQFFLSAMGDHAEAPQFGHRSLEAYFQRLIQSEQQYKAQIQ